MKRGEKRVEKRADAQGAPMVASVLSEAGSGLWRSAISLALLLIRCFPEFVGSTSASDSSRLGSSPSRMTALAGVGHLRNLAT